MTSASGIAPKRGYRSAVILGAVIVLLSVSVGIVSLVMAVTSGNERKGIRRFAVQTSLATTGRGTTWPDERRSSTTTRRLRTKARLEDRRESFGPGPFG